jgi:hypothetical protein
MVNNIEIEEFTHKQGKLEIKMRTNEQIKRCVIIDYD